MEQKAYYEKPEAELLALATEQFFLNSTTPKSEVVNSNEDLTETEGLW